MEPNPKYQKQHRLSQVYLKHFGFKNDKSVWQVAIYEAGKPFTEIVDIYRFTAEVNIFDLPLEDPKDIRHFELQSAKIEREYTKLLNTIHNQKQLIPKHKDIINHFTAMILCKTEPFRHFINDALLNPRTHEGIIDEFMMYEEISETTSLKEFLSQHHDLNIAIGYVTNYLVRCFRNFRKIIFKSNDGRGWLTTDNPVVMDDNGTAEWIVPIEAEFYFPLSRDYCLFMYHERSKVTSNPLRNYQYDKVYQASVEVEDFIQDKVSKGYFKYLVFNTCMPTTILSIG